MESTLQTNGASEPVGNDAYFRPANVAINTAPAPSPPASPPGQAPSSGGVMSRTEIFRAAIRSRHRAPLDMPEWGGTFYVREMTRQQQELAKGARTARRYTDGSVSVEMEPLGVRMRCYMQCIETELGDRVFADSDIGDFLNLPTALVERITEAVDKVTSPPESETTPEEMASDPT